MSLGTSQMFPNGADVWSATASAEFSAPYRFAKQTTTAEENYKVAPAGAGEECLGIATARAGVGDPVGVATSSVGALEVNAASVNIAAGDKIKSAANGIGVKAATAADKWYAVALDPATTDGAVIRVLIRHGVVPA